MGVSKLRHPGWLVVLLPVLLALPSTLTPGAARIVLLAVGVLAATIIYHLTEHGGKQPKRTAIALVVSTALAVVLFLLLGVIDTRLKPKEVARSIPPVPTRKDPAQDQPSNTLTNHADAKKPAIPQPNNEASKPEHSRSKTANPPSPPQMNSAPSVGTINVQQGGAASVGQQGGITAGTVIVNNIPVEPGYGMLMTQPTDYVGKPLVYLRRQLISADQKATGDAYITVLLSIDTADRRVQQQANIDDVLNVLRQLHGIKVFYTPSPGGYSLVKDGMIWTTGTNIAGVAEFSECVFYFRDETKAIAERIKAVLGDRIKHFQKRTPSAHQLLDVLEYSGIDLEVIL